MDKRKELIQAYKQTNLPMGVYQIKNHRNGKIFVGSSLNVPGKFNSHRFSLNYKSHRITSLQDDWNNYGPDAFSFDILELLKPEDIPAEYRRKALLALEDKWLDKLHPYDEAGYNKPKKKNS